MAGLCLNVVYTLTLVTRSVKTDRVFLCCKKRLFEEVHIKQAGGVILLRFLLLLKIYFFVSVCNLTPNNQVIIRITCNFPHDKYDLPRAHRPGKSLSAGSIHIQEIT